MGKGGGEMEVRNGIKGELARVCWQEVPDRSPGGGLGS